MSDSTHSAKNNRKTRRLCICFHILAFLPQPSPALDKPRRHILTFHDTVPPGVVKPALLPSVLKHPIMPAQFRIYTGPALSRGKITIRVGLAEKPDVNEVRLAARMDSVECTPLTDNINLDKFPESKRVRQSMSAARRAAIGQFFTPRCIVEFMVRMVEGV